MTVRSKMEEILTCLTYLEDLMSDLRNTVLGIVSEEVEMDNIPRFESEMNIGDQD